MAVTEPGPREGDALPLLEIPVTRTLIVSGALASRDFQDVHHDAEAAQQKGSPDIFMNILTTNGLVGRYVVDWAGPHAVLHKVAIRLGAPNHPGDTMKLTGQVVAVMPAGPAAPGASASDGALAADGGTLVEIAVRGANRLGNHVTGTVTVTVPAAAPGGSGAPEREGTRS